MRENGTSLPSPGMLVPQVRPVCSPSSAFQPAPSLPFLYLSPGCNCPITRSVASKAFWQVTPWHGDTLFLSKTCRPFHNPMPLYIKHFSWLVSPDILFNWGSFHWVGRPWQKIWAHCCFYAFKSCLLNFYYPPAPQPHFLFCIFLQILPLFSDTPLL